MRQFMVIVLFIVQKKSVCDLVVLNHAIEIKTICDGIGENDKRGLGENGVFVGTYRWGLGDQIVLIRFSFQ